MTAMDSLIQRYRSWPRAIQWASLAAAGMALFLIWDNTIRGEVEDLDKKIKMIESRVDRVRDNDEVARKLRDPQMESVVLAFGPAGVPPSVADGSKMFDDVVAEVFQKHRVSSYTMSSRPGTKLPKNVLLEVTEGKARIDRLSGEVKFDATPAAAIAILADLDSSQHIHAVNSIRMTRDTAGKVKVTLTVESWLRSAEKSAGETL